MINSIYLKNVASYNTGVEISELKKVNFFFGYNGTGKSTIAKYLYNLSQEHQNQDERFENCSQVGYDPLTNQILTFDENFTESNFNRSPYLKGVFSLNQQNDLIDRQIRDEQNLITDYEQNVKSKESLKNIIDKDKEKKENELLETCWESRNQFSTFIKIKLKHSGSKPNNLAEIKSFLQKTTDTVPTITQLFSRYQILYEKEITKVDVSINFELYRKIRILEKKINKLLQEVIVGNEDVDIAELITKLNSRKWVESGIEFLDDEENICPFCQKETIDENLRSQFENYFDETYKEKIEKIEKLKSDYIKVTNDFLTSIQDIQNVFNPDNLVSNIYIKLNELFSENIDVIDNKLENTNEKLVLNSINQVLHELSKISNSIRENNNFYADIEPKRKELINDIWIFIALSCKSQIEDFDNRVLKYQRIFESINHFVGNIKSKIQFSEQKIETLRSQTVNTKEAVDNINRLLKNNGFNGFEIAEKENENSITQYYLKRPDSTEHPKVFRSLSEGEKNFISFLYFYQLCIGTDDLQSNSSKKKIIVIDDPVSSLDNQALFIVSTLIHNLILRKGKSEKREFKNQNIEQVFILTHNLYFYKEVCFDRRPICTDYKHYKISKNNNLTQIVGQSKKFLTDDYSLLWETVKRIKTNLPQNSSSNILIANSMRRIIESYVRFIGLGNDSWSSLLSNDASDPSYLIKSSFISTINDESHSVSVLDSVYYQRISSEQPQLLFDIFKDIFKEIGKEHYELMMDEVILS